MADFFNTTTTDSKIKTIIPTQQFGFSDELEVSGRKGRFNFSVPPKFDQGIGGGKSPMFKFMTDEGEVFFHRLESDKQGSRWEDGKDAMMEFQQMQQNPQLVQQFWGNSPIGRFLEFAIQQDLSFDKVKPLLKNFNTHRQISGD
ncbi:MAG TPA: hypothetical protein ENH85_09840 [Candidatus Scalindua sp.]|nr:hypothetical protein [Candidatus Scalindua sp.]